MSQTTHALKNGKGWVQEWDARDRLVKVERTNGADSRTVTFKYDPFNRRIEKKVVDIFSGVTATTTTAYVYDGEDIVLQIETIDAGGTSTVTESRFIHGPGIDEPLAMVRGGQNYFYHADGLGSIVAITNQSQTIVQKYSYETFGLPTPSDPSFRQPYSFTARERDYETGLYFYRARYYDPMEGRFISKDPIGFAGGDVNLYGYVFENPINLADPSGLDTWSGAGDEVGGFFLFGGTSTMYSFVTNWDTGEKCYLETICYKVGVGMCGGVTANSVWILNGPKSGKDLAGVAVGGGAEGGLGGYVSGAPAGTAGVNAHGSTGANYGAGIGAGFAMYGSHCTTRVISCSNTPKQTTCE